MPRSSGTYTLPSGNPVVTGTVISSTTFNNTMNDIASALTQSVSKDGQTTMTGDLPMGNTKLTGLAAGTSNGDSVRYEQVVPLGGALGTPSSGDLSNCTGGPTLTNATLVTPALGTPSSGTLDNCTGGPTLTSPTLVTPALGTPSSGTLDNCTGPWVSTYTLHVQDQKASGAQGGASAAATQNVRTLNTVVTNTITGASLATNQITLPAGTYRVWARAPAFNTNNHKIRLYNVTDAAVTAVGSSEYASSTYDGSSDSSIQGYRFTISGTKVFRLDHYTSLSRVSNGLGPTTGSGDIEVYAEVMVIKE